MRNCVRPVAVLFIFSLFTFAQVNNLDALKREALEKVDGRQQLVQQMVDQIFSYAELGFQEVETSKYVTGILEKNGFKVERGVAGIPTAWVATYGSGKPVIGFITDIDCIPRASQKPGVAYHDPIIDGAPGHGEGHNSGMPLNITAALAAKKIMEREHLPGTLRIWTGTAEELVGKEIEAVVRAVPGTPVKVILETAALSQDEKLLACRLARDAGAMFVKTSGGIRTLAEAQAMINAGANRIGTSASAAILAALESPE